MQGVDFDTKAVRLRLGMSQDEFARALEMAANTVTRWEMGRIRPTKETVEKIRLLESRMLRKRRTQQSTEEREQREEERDLVAV